MQYKFIRDDEQLARVKFTHVLSLPESVLRSINDVVKLPAPDEGAASADALARFVQSRGVSAHDFFDALELIKAFLFAEDTLSPKDLPKIDDLVTEFGAVDVSRPYQAKLLLDGLAPASFQALEYHRQNFWKWFRHFRKGVAGPPEQEADAMLLGELVGRFLHSKDEEHAWAAAAEIVERKDKLDGATLDLLRTHANGVRNGADRARSLQLLAEIQDSGSVPIFLRTIATCAEENRVPDLPVIVAISYVRVFRPLSDVDRLVSWIVRIANQAPGHSFPSRKEFKGGVIVTLGAIGSVDSVGTTLVRFLADPDDDIVEAALYALSGVTHRWLKADERPGRLAVVSEVATGQLDTLVRTMLPRVEADHDRGISSPVRILRQAVGLLGLVQPDRLLEHLPIAFKMAFERKRMYLIAGLLQALKRVPDRELKRAVVQKILNETRGNPADIVLEAMESV